MSEQTRRRRTSGRRAVVLVPVMLVATAAIVAAVATALAGRPVIASACALAFLSASAVFVVELLATGGYRFEVRRYPGGW
ncbi:hypothetical protein ACWEKJ_20770 [Amycolatopsis thermoflava]|uniref:hypothetical protein n=1 Tax=Amycolatopsis thermoflava TaxID=84480 RepID=UPI003EBD00E5